MSKEGVHHAKVKPLVPCPDSGNTHSGPPGLVSPRLFCSVASREEVLSQTKGLKVKGDLWQELASSIQISLLLHEAKINFLRFPLIN